MSYQIFISYRRNGGDALAYLLFEHLHTLGYNVFYDLDSLSSGKFDTKLLKYMDECSDVLVILSPHALDRCNDKNDWLCMEITHALQSGKNIIPLIMGGFEWPEDLPKEIEELHNYNAVTVSFDFFEGVMSRVLKYLACSSKSIKTINQGMEVKHILLWGDFDEAYLNKIADKLKLESGKYDIEILDNPMTMLSKKLDEVFAIILIVTDCTKFSNNSYAVERINETLAEYVKCGGKLISAHDVIYRRTRNKKIQDIYGCMISKFRDADKVQYCKTEECVEKNAFSSLPDKFFLHDFEICWGNLSDDTDVYFETEDGIPLVFAREYGRGICINLNSGDFRERLSKSLLKPEKEFIDLLREAIVMEF